MKRKARRVALTFAALIVVVAAVLAGLTWRAVRQEWLNRALIEACKRTGDKAAVRLLDQGADPNCREKPIAPISPLRMLLDMLQGKLSLQRLDTMTPLAYAAGGNDQDGSKGSESASEDTRLVSALLDHGADPNAPAALYDAPPCSPLLWSVGYQRAIRTRLLLARGARVNRDEIGQLLAAAVDEEPECLADLLEHGADINRRLPDREGQTCLMAASDRADVSTVKVLLDHHTSVNLQDANGKTALDHAWEAKAEEMLRAGNGARNGQGHP